MKRKEVVANCIFFAFLALVTLGLFFNFRYISSLEEQVYQRDSLIRELSFSDQLVREYFDIQVDSSGNTRSYTLKDNKKTRIIEKHEVEIEMDGKKYNSEQVIDEYLNLVREYNSLVERYNALASDYNSLIDEIKSGNSIKTDLQSKSNYLSVTVDSLRRVLQEKEYYLRAISQTYGILCDTYQEGNTIHYSMKGSPRLDSALRIYPYFHDLSIYDKEKDVWIVSIPNKKHVEKTIEIRYR